jgi:hypothetical protein
VAALPDQLDRKTHVDLRGFDLERYFRAALLLIFVGISAAGLANVFGQHTDVTSVDSPEAKLALDAPRAARGGLIYQAKFRVDAHRDLAKPTLVLAPGWFDGLTINTVQPDAVTWGQRNGLNTIQLPAIAAGDHFVLRLQYQVNPTVIGVHDQDVQLTEGGAPIASIDHSQTIFP